jgi:hypothetical protein
MVDRGVADGRPMGSAASALLLVEIGWHRYLAFLVTESAGGVPTSVGVLMHSNRCLRPTDNGCIG